MHENGHDLPVTRSNGAASSSPSAAPLQWSWEVEHADRKREVKADAPLHGATPFQVDRRVLKDVVRENQGKEVGRIEFLSAGTFHKAYLITLSDHSELVAGVARRYMPRLKTESEVATMHYLREKTNIPVPTVYHYDSNPYNRLGGEYILMSKAPGVPLATVFHSLCYTDLVKLLENVATMVLELFAHRFSDIGSLYFGPNPCGQFGSSAPTPKAVQHPYSAFPFSPTLSMSNLVTSKLNNVKLAQPLDREFHVGPIISWPFFGTHRGELTHPTELNRGPWSNSNAYFASCCEREINGVIRENEGKAAPHRLHLDPDEIHSSRHHRLRAVPGDESDDSDEYDLEESEEEWEGPGDIMYRDYRRMQRTTFLIAHLKEREERVRQEMARWKSFMDRLMKATLNDAPESFSLDCHDLSLENIFVDAKDNWKITCIIDWESTTTRPLWQCAHLPAFAQTSAFIGRLFREAIAKVGRVAEASASTPTKHGKDIDLAALSREWLYYESAGQRLRMAHRFVEWDGWEEGLVDSILGPEEHEEDWFRDLDDVALKAGLNSPPVADPDHRPNVLVSAVTRRKPSKLPFAKEKEQEQMLNTTGDYCGGRGGELGRRLEAWLTVNGIEEGRTPPAGVWEREREGEPRDHRVLVE
ncbi:putative phosphotransferase enzyme family protein [Lyophyllum shimeji]|uniref:Phosphotransferase enzyme family protein n=1 Tax=Lyophyllum shimeji TaxID=47721 RepID=A0A9P3UN49_LYOSH|nr:putative phosphotransferase enzyme family protein [Lyophyllum shimeji]